MGVNDIRQIDADAVTVDLGELQNGGRIGRRRAGEAMLEILAGNGFMYVAGHDVPESLLDSVYEQARGFFDRDLDDKNRFYIGAQRNHRGYVPVAERGDYEDEDERRYEAFDLGPGKVAGDYDPNNPLAGPNVYPDQPGFRMAIGRYLTEVQRVSHVIARSLAEVLGLPASFFVDKMTRPTSQLRLLHYFDRGGPARSPQSTGHQDDPVGMGAHTDYEAFTILHSRNPGLQVLHADGYWANACPVPGTFYFNIGDLMEAWTGGLVKATPHRVIDSGKERYSLPYFCGVDYETVVAPVKVPGRHIAQSHYQPFVAGRHLVSQLERDFPYLRRDTGTERRSDRFNANPFEERMRRLAS